MMKAAVYEEFGGQIKVKNIPKPKLSSKYSVIVNVMATGVCRSDWHGWKGHDDDIKKHGLPFIPGHELAGIIVEKGSAVQKLSIGNRVAIPFILSCNNCVECKRNKPTVCLNQSQPGFTMNGSFAEFVEITKADHNLRIIPEGVSFVEAAALGCRFTTAYRAVVQQGLEIDNIQDALQNRRRISKGLKKNICVFGAGGLGLSCIVIAKAMKNILGSDEIGDIIAVDVSQAALLKAKEVGATLTINVRDYDMNNEKVRQRVYELTGGNGAELTIDAAGFIDTCENAVYTCRRGCRMVQVGLPIGGRPPMIPMGTVAGRELELVGSHGFSAKDLPTILQLVKSGTLRVKDLIEKEVTLEEGAKALMDMDKVGQQLGMTVITRFDDSCRL